VDVPEDRSQRRMLPIRFIVLFSVVGVVLLIGGMAMIIAGNRRGTVVGILGATPVTFAASEVQVAADPALKLLRGQMFRPSLTNPRRTELYKDGFGRHGPTRYAETSEMARDNREIRHPRKTCRAHERVKGCPKCAGAA
jgi:hypothetical protein